MSPTKAEDEYSYPLHMTGFASTLPYEDSDGVPDAVRRLHEVVAEVTGRSVEAPQKEHRRIGFV